MLNPWKPGPEKASRTYGGGDRARAQRRAIPAAMGLVIGTAMSAAPAVAQNARASDTLRHSTPSTLTAFTSDTELTRYLRQLVQAERARVAAERRARLESCGAKTSVVYRQATALVGIGSARREAVVRGVVHTSSGPVSGAVATLSPLAVMVAGDDSGRFRIRVPAARLATAESLSLGIRRIGYVPRHVQLLLGPGDTADVDVGMCSQAVQLDNVVVSGPSAAAPGVSITNTQHAGVDEGDIVKLAGRYLVVLRRGRLFTIDVGRRRTGDHTLRPVAAVDAFGPDVDPRWAWYDELLVSADRVVVIGYSYERGGTELGLFRLDGAGHLSFDGTYQLRSNDYYSSRNYASRLIGNTLIFYAPLAVPPDTERPLAILPALRAWRGHAGDKGFQAITTARRVYRAPVDSAARGRVALHTVTLCDLGGSEFRCRATVVVGPPGEVLYVSPTAVYVWTVADRSADTARTDSTSRSVVYRLPLDGGPPQALRVAGSPVDQLSFLEGADGYLNVLVSSSGHGDWMWRAESSQGELALLRVPLSSFGDGKSAAPRSRYRVLPADTTHAGTAALQNRFVGDWLLYGVGNGWGQARTITSSVFAVRVTGGDVVRLCLPHGVDRLDALGRDAIVIGSSGEDLHFTGIDLGGDPVIREHYVLPDAAQGELRTHGFFYRQDAAGAGTLGIPVRAAGQAGYVHLFQGSAGVLFLRNAGGAFSELGTLGARAGVRATDAADKCRASCVDWYGNARPLFVRDRVFALLGYELVEGRVNEGRLSEVRRISFAP